MADFRVELEKTLEAYSKEVNEEATAIIKEVAQEAANKLKQTSPKSKGGGKHYASGWAIKKQGEKAWVVYNKNKPGLTHLLEKGHAKVKGGRVAGRAHIQPVEAWANREVVERIERKL